MNRLSKMLVIAAAVAVATVGFAVPAGATEAQGYVGGAGAVTDDWGDEGVVDINTNADSGATGLWQWVLYADGAVKNSSGSLFAMSDIDFDFGPVTQFATKKEQAHFGFSTGNQDGSAGPMTWGAADAHLTLVSSSGCDNIEYHGVKHTIEMVRCSGEYYIYSVSCFNSAGGDIFNAPAVYGKHEYDSCVHG